MFATLIYSEIRFSDSFCILVLFVSFWHWDKINVPNSFRYTLFSLKIPSHMSFSFWNWEESKRKEILMLSLQWPSTQPLFFAVCVLSYKGFLNGLVNSYSHIGAKLSNLQCIIRSAHYDSPTELFFFPEESKFLVCFTAWDKASKNVKKRINL